jgi:multicomponent Na+:H+ antiporter subunit F
MTAFFWGLGIFILLNAFFCLWRAQVGPTLVDRLLAMNVVGTKTLVVLVLLGFIFGREIFLGVAFVYGLLNLVITLAATRLLERGRLGGEWQR